MKKDNNTHIAVFRGRNIRKTIHNNEWWFSVVDVVETLTDSVNPRDYWYKMKIRVKDEDGLELSTLCRQLKFMYSGCKEVISKENYLGLGNPDELRQIEGK